MLTPTFKHLLITEYSVVFRYGKVKYPLGRLSAGNPPVCRFCGPLDHRLIKFHGRGACLARIRVRVAPESTRYTRHCVFVCPRCYAQYARRNPHIVGYQMPGHYFAVKWLTVKAPYAPSNGIPYTRWRTVKVWCH